MESTVIKTNNLKKNYVLKKREGGLKGGLKGVFSSRKKIVEAVKGIELEVKKGELIGFIGPNGAGKTTTLKMLSGILYPTSGQIRVLGHDPVKRNHGFLKKISLIMGQKNQLWWDLPVIDSFTLHKEVYEIEDKVYERRLDELVELFQIESLLEQQTRKLSLGQRMKCELVLALLHKPEIIFLDEPTIGLDILMQKKLRNFIREYNKRYEATVLLTSHYMEDVKEVCDRVVIINDGSIVFDGAISALISKYANYKTISVVVKRNLDISKVKTLGQIIESKEFSFMIKVSKNEISKVVANILEKFEIEDLDINEPRLENVVEEIFKSVVS